MAGGAVTPRLLQVGPDAFPYVDEGEGEPLLFLHGVPGDWQVWEPHIAILSARHRCIAFTQRWFGSHAWRPDGPAFGTTELVADLVAFCDALGTGPLSLVAWSFGSHVAFAAAMDRPRLFRRILVYEPGFSTYVEDEDELEAFRADAKAAFAPVSAAVERGDLDAALREMIDVSGGTGFFDRQPERDRALQRAGRSVIPRLLSQTRPADVRCADLAALPMPVTVAWGARSRPLFEIPSRAAARCTGRGCRVPDRDHMWPATHPESFAAFVEERL
jgi:pimeloyl-ACP methyl ester carboxylesterase